MPGANEAPPSAPTPFAPLDTPTCLRRCRHCSTRWPTEARSPLVGTRCDICGYSLVHPDDFLDALQLDTYIQFNATMGWHGDGINVRTLKEDIVASLVPYVAEVCQTHYTMQGRAQGCLYEPGPQPLWRLRQRAKGYRV